MLRDYKLITIFSEPLGDAQEATESIVNEKLIKGQLTAPPAGGNILEERSHHASTKSEFIDSNRDGFGAAQDDSFFCLPRPRLTS